MVLDILGERIVVGVLNVVVAVLLSHDPGQRTAEGWERRQGRGVFVSITTGSTREGNALRGVGVGGEGGSTHVEAFVPSCRQQGDRGPRVNRRRGEATTTSKYPQGVPE